ncbi:ATP-binding protein [Pelagicoccus albus]|uniref:Putative DNA binding domain-containing protein n=1 Tax=Pelagicoccus albus TaxID=415222 RepID=A0A7X1B5P2_9BACT|nr:ATP-binding protein [Pelagicoccus albus]MBC2606087.1 putative DNA binding domain-containing protein [Pelagicoccus albus]
MESQKQTYLLSLVEELCKLPKETEWVEFKHNNEDPEAIGEYISALANSAVYCGKVYAYLLWGVEDTCHEIVGTNFNPSAAKVGAEELENWLLRLLAPKLNFSFHLLQFGENTVVLLEIQASARQPVQFKGQEYIRIGSYKKKLKEHPERERELWRIFDRTPFEQRIAKAHLNGHDALDLLDFPSYFELLSLPLPSNSLAILESLESESIIQQDDAGLWNITNLGAILFAKKLDSFGELRRKAVRVIQYKGEGRIVTVREQIGSKGYAAGFSGLVEYINGLLPSNEVIGQALRKKLPMFPELAIRELVANALIHQDFSQTGNGPMVEIFDSRMEITNPGQPLVKPERFLDSPPKSRNEAIASFMRRIGVCEERGSGIDKVVFETEYYQLPAPRFELAGDSLRSVLFAYKELKEMDKEERIQACYLHACLLFVHRKLMTNSSLRERFKIEEHNRAIASRIINDSIEAGWISPRDPDQGRKHAKYVPFWAGELSL